MKLLNTTARQSAGRILALSALAFVWSVDANAEWTVIQLHPREASRSWAIGVGHGEQAGFATVDGADHACLWGGSAKSWVDLNPMGVESSQARSVEGGHQVGSAVVGGVPRASLWNRTPASWEDLTPYWAGATQSVGSGLGGGVQVGAATVDGVSRASVWYGSAASWVDLHPFEATYSHIRATDGVQQVGVATVDGSWRASLWWYGEVGSWEDLTPEGAWGSYAAGVHDGQQVGYVWFGDPGSTVSRASLWEETAESWVDLTPAGTNVSSCAYAVYDGQQVGVVGFRASQWDGTAESYVDLHAFLPRQFTSSVALGIWCDATYTYVVGYGYNSKRERQEALMWLADNSPPSAPGEVAVDDISPNTMSAGDTIDVTITGSGFQPEATVTFENGAGQAPAADVTYVSGDGFTIEATITAPSGGPQGERVWDVRVTNPDASAGVLTAGFTVIR